MNKDCGFLDRVELEFGRWTRGVTASEQKRKVLVSTLSVIMVLFSVGCRKIERDDVVGTYIANHGKGLEEIEVKPDGTYTYTCRLKDGSNTTNRNEWEFHYDYGEPRITFDHFQFCLSPYSKTPPGYWDVQAQRSMTGGLRLDLDSDVNYYYIKQ